MDAAAVAQTVVEKSFWDWTSQILTTYWPLFLKGAAITLFIAVIGTLIGTAIGLMVGMVRTIPLGPKDSRIKKTAVKCFNGLLSAYVEFFRGTPMMVQAMAIFYGMALLGVYMDRIFAGVLIVSINTGAYMSEIVRGGILSIDKGQFEAAHSIGMTHRSSMFNIIMPQVIRNILPATGNEFVINIKDTSVLNVISVTELFYNSKSISGNNFRYFEVFLITAIIYFVLTFTITRILRLIERKLDGKGTYTIHGSHTQVDSEMKVRAH